MVRAMVLPSLLAALVLGACAGSPWSPRTPAPLPSEATALTLATAPPAEPLPAGVEWGCPDQLIGDVRVFRVGSAVAFEWVGAGQVDLVWPRGFSARLRDGETEIVAPDGSVIARGRRDQRAAGRCRVGDLSGRWRVLPTGVITGPRLA